MYRYVVNGYTQESQLPNNHEVNVLFADIQEPTNLHTIPRFSCSVGPSLSRRNLDGIPGGTNGERSGRARYNTSVLGVAASQAHRTVCARPSGLATSYVRTYVRTYVKGFPAPDTIVSFETVVELCSGSLEPLLPPFRADDEAWCWISNEKKTGCKSSSTRYPDRQKLRTRYDV